MSKSKIKFLIKNNCLRNTNILLILHQYVHHSIALKKLSDLCVSFFKFLFAKFGKNNFLIYFKSEKNYLVSFQYLKKTKRFSKLIF